MSGDIVGKSPEPSAGDGYMGLFKKLKREEILEILSEGFCKNCESLLEKRTLSFMNKKVSDAAKLNGSTEHLASDASNKSSYSDKLKNDEVKVSCENGGSSEYEKELTRCSQVGRKKDFVYIERIKGKSINVLQGLELHTNVFNAEEQKEIVEHVYMLQGMGRDGRLRRRTYLEPNKWKRGKGRVTIQFGCCYNYGDPTRGRPGGIDRDEEVDPMPPLFKKMIKRMVGWHILPPSCVPDSCIVNMYDEGDCIPPHIDHHDFLRPFCTVSFLTECNILFGSQLEVVGAGQFSGPVSLPLPVGSVLILNGNGADIAKHCVPSVPAKRISITFRKMDVKKVPYEFKPDPELLNSKPLDLQSHKHHSHRPLVHPSFLKSIVQQTQHQNEKLVEVKSRTTETTDSAFNEREDFPPLALTNSGNRTRADGARSNLSNRKSGNGAWSR